MRREIQRVVPKSAAKVVGLMYAALFLAISLLILLPFAALVPLHDQAGNPRSSAPLVVMAVVYPFAGAIGGWLGAFFMASIYNLLVPRVGGIQVDVSDTSGG